MASIIRWFVIIIIERTIGFPLLSWGVTRVNRFFVPGDWAILRAANIEVRVGITWFYLLLLLLLLLLLIMMMMMVRTRRRSSTIIIIILVVAVAVVVTIISIVIHRILSTSSVLLRIGDNFSIL